MLRVLHEKNGILLRKNRWVAEIENMNLMYFCRRVIFDQLQMHLLKRRLKYD